MSRKTGKLSMDERSFITNHVDEYSIEQMALQLNRTQKPILRFIKDNNLTYRGMSEEKYDDSKLYTSLMSKPYFAEVEKQFTKDEVEYFTINWIRLMQQFRQDVLYTEELDIKQLITLDILANRNMSDRKEHIAQTERIQIQLNKERDKPEDTQNIESIAMLDAELSVCRSSLGSYTSEHVKILDKIDKINKGLKAQRDQRIKRIEDSKSSWSGYLKSLENEDTRAKAGEDAEIMRLAKDQAVKELSNYHTYDDGSVDMPFLTPDTVGED